jgi:hypothetical protein
MSDLNYCENCHETAEYLLFTRKAFDTFLNVRFSYNVEYARCSKCRKETYINDLEAKTNQNHFKETTKIIDYLINIKDGNL